MFGSFPKFHKRNISTEIILKLACNFCRRASGKLYSVLHTYFWIMVKFFNPNLGVDGFQNMFTLDRICTIIRIYKDGRLMMDRRDGLRAF